jgi:hypothetical protein
MINAAGFFFLNQDFSYIFTLLKVCLLFKNKNNIVGNSNVVIN